MEKYESLARILVNGEVVSPAFFIEPARLAGQLPQLTRRMIEKSFAYFSGKEEHFTLNITESDLLEGYLVEYLREMSVRYGIAPGRVALEVLENVSAEGTREALAQLQTFREMGFEIALDDFGSEKSNFHRLQELQVHYIKIDGAYIKNVHENENNYKIVRTIAAFAKSIGAKVVAEYVADEKIQNIVMELGIDYSQGYFFGKPEAEILR